jgi:hypothetical protein
MSVMIPPNFPEIIPMNVNPVNSANTVLEPPRGTSTRIEYVPVLKHSRAGVEHVRYRIVTQFVPSFRPAHNERRDARRREEPISGRQWRKLRKSRNGKWMR